MIKRVFILEDNEHKLDDIVSCLKGHFKEDIRVDSCEYFNRGIGKLLKGTFDYAIIDNTVPRFPDSHELVTDAAEEALRYLYWEEDNKHQSYAGAYLSACVHLSTIFNIDVRSANFIGLLDEATANTFQEAAYNTVFK